MARPPHLLLFMPETLRADAVLGALEARAKTPNMDRLAAEGVSFTNCFAQSAYCAPSRCSMFTGLYPHTCGHRSLFHLLRRNERNLFRDLKEAGYRTVAYGKNDLMAQDAIEASFDEVGTRVQPQIPTYMPNPWPEDHKLRHSFYHGRRDKGQCRDSDWAYVQSALRFLDEEHDRPFCVFLPLEFVHPPYEVEEPFFSMHARALAPAPIPARAAGGERSYMRELRAAHGLERLQDGDWREIKATYFGMVSRVDHQLGLLMDRLKQRGLYEQTAIVVFSDHGDYAGDYGMVEKYLSGAEDCLLHVPLIVRVPGCSGGRQLHGLCELTDLYPTLLEIAGLAPGHSQFGRSLAQALWGRPVPHRDAVFAEGGFHHDEQQFWPHVEPSNPYAPMLNAMRQHPRMTTRAAMVRTERHKYVYCPGDRDELYDLEADPQQLVNLAESEGHASVREGLRERLMRWMLDTADVLPMERDPRGWR